MLWNNAPQRFFEWCFGAWSAHQVVQGVRLRLPYVWGLLTLLVLWIFNKATLQNNSFQDLFQVLFDPILGCFIGLILWSLIVNEDRLRLNRVCLPIIYLGKISYGVYLVHQIFVPYVNLSLKSIPLNDASHFILVLLGVLILTLPVSVLFHQLIEIPFSQRGTKLQV